jgi:SAM-dependent methyltransferase
MRRFWDARAREDALWFIDSRLDYGDGDLQQFWAGGVSDLEAVLDAVDATIWSADVVVDVGCGAGRLTRAIAARAGRVIGIDISTEMLTKARELNADLENVDFRVGDGVSLAGIDDGVADVLVSHVVFQHITDPAITLGYVRDMGRVLKPGGWAAFQISTDPSIHHSPPGRLKRRAAALLGRGPNGVDDAPWLGSAVSIDALRTAADDGGLDVDAIANPHTQYSYVRLRRRD